MGTGCPICNGSSQLAYNCPDCGARMIDYGGLESYSDPYGPYEEQGVETTPDQAVSGDGQCIHLLQCPQCNESVTYPVDEEMFI